MLLSRAVWAATDRDMLRALCSAQLCDACTSHVTRHTSHATRHTPHVTRHTSHVTRHTSHVTRHTSHVTRHTSHATRHTSHVTRHTSNARSILLPRRRARWRRWQLSSRGRQERGGRFGGGRLLLAAAKEQRGHAEFRVIRLQEQARQRPVSMTHFISSLIIAVACSTLPLPTHARIPLL